MATKSSHTVMCNSIRYSKHLPKQLYGKVMIVSRQFLLTITVSMPSGNSMRIQRESCADVVVHVVLCSILTRLLSVRGGCTSSTAVSSARLTDFCCSILGRLYRRTTMTASSSYHLLIKAIVKQTSTASNTTRTIDNVPIISSNTCFSVHMLHVVRQRINTNTLLSKCKCRLKGFSVKSPIRRNHTKVRRKNFEYASVVINIILLDNSGLQTTMF